MKKETKIYSFEDYNIDLVYPLEINEADDGIIGDLLDEYRESDEEYDTDGWFEFLVSKGYEVKDLRPDFTYHF